MPFSYQQIPTMSNFLSETEYSLLQPPDAVPPMLNRCFIGIPAENDEYTRGLNFFFDPSTGQPSVHSASEESENQIESPAYQHSQSSNNTSSHIVLTPKSTSDSSDEPRPRTMSHGSGRSSESGLYDRDAMSQHCPSVSARASAGTSEAAHSLAAYSPALSQVLVHMPTMAQSPAATMSPDTDLSMSNPFDPIEDMKDPRDIIDIGPSDVEYLQAIRISGTPSGIGHQAQMFNPMHLVNAQINGSMVPHHPVSAQVLRATSNGAGQKTDIHQRQMAIRSKRGSRPRNTGVSNKAAMEKSKKMRQLGSCLPCLVNHEPVSTLQRQLFPFVKGLLTFKVWP